MPRTEQVIIAVIIYGAEFVHECFNFDFLEGIRLNVTSITFVLKNLINGAALALGRSDDQVRAIPYQWNHE